MSDQEALEPTNKQLANFLVVYAKQFPFAENLQLDSNIIEELLETNPIFRASGLRHHREFTETIKKHEDKMLRGKLQCEHVRPNGKRCPNFNKPGSYYCGLHQDEEE